MNEKWNQVVSCENSHDNPLKEVHFVGLHFWCPDCGSKMDLPDIKPATLEKREVQEIDPTATCETESCERDARHKITRVLDISDVSTGKPVQVVEKYRCCPCKNAVFEVSDPPVEVSEALRIDSGNTS